MLLITAPWSLADNDPGEKVAPAPGHVHSRVGPLRQHLAISIVS